MRNFKARCMLVMAILALALIPAVPATAAESFSEDQWQFQITLYLWGADIGGKTGRGTDISVDFGDIFSNMEMGFFGGLGLRKGRWSLMADVIYLDAEADKTILAVPVKAELTTWVVTPNLGYTVIHGVWGHLDLVGGARYLSADTTVHVGPFRRDPSNDFWDGIIGLRGRVNFTEHWHLPYYVDIGTGDTDLTWQALVGLGYSWTSVDLVVGYRYLQWDFDDSSFLDDMNLSGPFGGVRIWF